MTDIKFIADQFQSKTLPKTQWTHHAHIAVAFVQVDKFKNAEKTLDSLRHGIKAYNISVGTENTDTSGYHETLTVFWLTAVYEYYIAKPSINVDEMYNGFIYSALASATFPEMFYSKELLFSKAARQGFIEPDRMPMSAMKEIVAGTNS